MLGDAATLTSLGAAAQRGFLSRAGQVFHHQPRAAARDVGNNSRAPMNFCDYAEIDGKSKLYCGAFAERKIGGFDEDAIGAQIARTAELARLTGK